MLDVIQIVFDARVQIGIAAPAVHLRPAGNPGLDHMFFHVIRHLILKHFHKIRTLRARADNGHIAQQHIDQLRQLVQAGFPQKGAKPWLRVFRRDCAQTAPVLASASTGMERNFNITNLRLFQPIRTCR